MDVTDPWLRRIHDALDAVLADMGADLKELSDHDRIGEGQPPIERAELIASTVTDIEFWIAGRLKGFREEDLKPGESSAEVQPGEGNFSF
jgi:hypothetical protein